MPCFGVGFWFESARHTQINNQIWVEVPGVFVPVPVQLQLNRHCNVALMYAEIKGVAIVQNFVQTVKLAGQEPPSMHCRGAVRRAAAVATVPGSQWCPRCMPLPGQGCDAARLRIAPHRGMPTAGSRVAATCAARMFTQAWLRPMCWFFCFVWPEPDLQGK